MSHVFFRRGRAAFSRIIHPLEAAANRQAPHEPTLRTRGISAPTTDIASEVVLVVVLGLETADDEDEEEDDEGNAGISR
jgi:hypothetical protein